MEPPSKRMKLPQIPYDSDEESNPDELSMTPSQFDARQDPMYQLDKGRAKAATRLKSTFESIFEKYEKDFTGIGDEIDLRTGEIIIDNGHLESLNDEKDGGREGSISSDEEERILRGKEARPAKRSHSMSLMPANPSSYNRTQSFEPWKQPAMSGAGAGAYRLPSLSMRPDMFGDPSQFPIGLSMFGNNPADPAWQVPELPSPYLQNGFGYGYGYGYNHQAPGFPQSLPFNRESARGAGMSYYGHHGHSFRRQRFKVVSAKPFSRRSLPTTESRESDTDEDDILLAHDSRTKPHDPPGQSTENPMAVEHDECRTGLHNKSRVENVSRENESVDSPTKQNKAKLLRAGPGRPKKTKSIEKLHKSDTKPGEAIHLVQPPKDIELTVSMSRSKSETPRRKPGRPKKLAVAEESTTSGPHAEAATSNLTTGSAFKISLPVRQNRASATQVLPTYNGIKITGQTSLDSQQRRSLRARKQTEFYGNLKWLKRGQKTSEHIEEINEELMSSQTSGDTLLHFTDSQDTSSTQCTESEQSDESEILSRPEDINRIANQLGEGSRIGSEADNGESIGNGPVSPPLLEDRYTENGKDTRLGQKSPALEPSLFERSDRNAGEPSLQTTETFSRNELDPSYNFSDVEEDLARKPVDSGTGIQSASQDKQTSNDGTSVFGYRDNAPHRHVGSNDTTIDRVSVVSEQSKVANSESSLDAGSFNTNRISAVLENSDEGVQGLPDDALLNIQLTTESDILQQGLECQQEPIAFEDHPNSPERSVASYGRGPTLSPDLGTEKPQSELEIASRLSPELGDINVDLQISIEKDPAEETGTVLTEAPNSPEARPVAIISNTHLSIPVTPKKPRRSDAEKNGTRDRHLTSSSSSSSVRKRFALASLIPDGAGNNNDGEDDDDDDEISIISSSHNYTPRSFRAKLSLAARRYSLSSSTPRKLTASPRSSLLTGTPVRQRSSVVPATDSRALGRVSRRRLGGDVQSSPLARAAAENALLRTPRRGLIKGPSVNASASPTSPTKSLARTPGGTMRRCGEDGFACERDFCFTCCK